jgi:hypothetical protein
LSKEHSQFGVRSGQCVRNFGLCPYFMGLPDRPAQFLFFGLSSIEF